MKLSGRRAVITGAADGIGRALSVAFAKADAQLLLFDLDGSKLEDLAATLRSEGARVETAQGSVTDTAAVEAAFARCDALLGGVDILVNNAGVTGNMPALEITDDFWDHVLGVNLRGSFNCARAAGRRMVAQRSGIILNMASMYGVVAAPERLAYCASKSAVCMMTKVLAVEWGQHNVRVNALAPGYVFTPSTEALVARGRLDIKRLEQRTPLGRLAEPDEVAELAVFACSQQAGYVTGQIFGIDGGWSAYGYV
jgi:NAD(P)-dependent dehydrogenase (short-subunit alcohol dehydrogenase family)